MGRTEDSAQVLCDQTGQQVVSPSKVGDHGAHPLAAEQFVAQSEPRVDRDTQHFRCPQISGWGIYRAAGKTGLQLKTQSLYSWDMTPLEYLTLERRVWRRQSPRQRRSQPLRTVGRDCRRQGREQDRVGEPDKREFQEDDNKVRVLRSSAEGGWPQWFQ